MHPHELILGLVLGVLGSAYLLYGRRQAAPLPLLSGLLLIIEPYMVPGFLAQLLVGVVLAAAPFLWR